MTKMNSMQKLATRNKRKARLFKVARSASRKPRGSSRWNSGCSRLPQREMKKNRPVTSPRVMPIQGQPREP